MLVDELKEKLETQDSFELGFICPSDLQNILKEIGTDFEEDWDTNGWNVDFCIYFYYNNIKYCFAGSWYYGNYKIYKEGE